MKTMTSLKLAAVAAFVLVSSAVAQPAMFDHGGAGLLGQKYSGFEFGYTHHVESAPNSLNRYGVVSVAPLPDIENLDGAFRYDYTRGSSNGIRLSEHDVRMGFTRFLTHQNAKPFLDVQLGWIWRKVAAVKDDSFVYQAGAGVELPITPLLALTPFVSFWEASHLGDRAWNFGARLGYRMHRQWNSSLTIQIDDAHNIEYAIGIQRRY